MTLITTIRHVEVMSGTLGPYSASINPSLPACVLAEGMRHSLYTLEEVTDRDFGDGCNRNIFSLLFGCTREEGDKLVFDNNSGESYYQSGKELLIKYGHGDLFEEIMDFEEMMVTFEELMKNLNEKETVIWNGESIPVTGVIS